MLYVYIHSFLENFISKHIAAIYLENGVFFLSTVCFGKGIFVMLGLVCHACSIVSLSVH